MAENKEHSNPVGRPPFYRSAKELQDKIDDYFINGVKKVPLVVGRGAKQEVIYIEKPTITGLVLFLGFCDRKSFYEYEIKPEFTHTIKNARTRIEMHYEELVQDGNTGAIFALKNFGWSDKREVEVNGNVSSGSPLENIRTKLQLDDKPDNKTD